MSHIHFYDPFTEFDRLFDDAFTARIRPSNSAANARGEVGNVRPQGTPTFRPRMDLHENTEANVVTATFELPGIKKEDVHIDIQNNRLVISGESSIQQERDESGYVLRERSYGKFSRTLNVPQGTNPEDIKASMENGVLHITFPKVNPAQAPKRITVA